MLFNGLFEDFAGGDIAVVDGGGGGGGVALAPVRNWSRKADTLCVDDELDGGCVEEGEELTLAADDIRVVLTALTGAADDEFEPELVIDERFKFEVLRAGVGGGGGLTFGGLGGATVGRPFWIKEAYTNIIKILKSNAYYYLPIGGWGADRKPELMASCDCAKGVRIVPKCCWVGNTGPPPVDVIGGDLRR